MKDMNWISVNEKLPPIGVKVHAMLGRRRICRAFNFSRQAMVYRGYENVCLLYPNALEAFNLMIMKTDKTDKIEGIENGIRPSLQEKELFKVFGFKMPTVVTWNTLMPVVEKCNKVNEEMQHKYPETKDIDDFTGWRAWSYMYVGLNTNINNVYSQIVDFIKIFNSQPKP